MSAARPPRWLVALVGYAVLTIALTWPVAPRLLSEVAFYNDSWIFVWDVAWVRRALLDPELEVFATRDVFYPEGISLAYHTLSPLHGALALPLTPWLGLVGSYNLLWLGTFFFSAVTMRALALRVTGSPGGAFLAGALYAFSPYHLAHAYHLNLLSLEFLPLTAWSLLAFYETGSRRAALAAALSAVLSLYACLEYALFSALLALLWLGYALATRGRGGIRLAALGDVCGRGLGAAALALGLGAAQLVPLIAEAAIERHYFDPVDVTFSADLFSWITPSVLHTLWGGYTMKVYQHFPGVLAEWTTYIGAVVALLMLAAIRRSRELRLGPFWLLFGVSALLAMGPWLRVLGEAWPVPLPYQLLKSLPVISAMREPSRFAALVTLATSLLAAAGYARLRSGRLGRLAWLALPLALVDFLQAPLPTSSAQVPAFLRELGADPERYAVLDVPSSLAIREHLYHQAIHRKPIFVGYIARIPEASRRYLDTLPLLRDPAGWDLDRDASRDRYARLARSLGVRYALVNQAHFARLGAPAGSFDRALASLLRLPGARLVAEEPGFAAVRLDGR